MAGKKRQSKKKKVVPAVRYLRYNLTNSGTPGTETSHYIDLARDLTAINRRLMRQGRIYHVKRVSIVSSNTIAGVGWTDGEFPPADLYQQNAGRVTLSTIPYSWVTVNAWQRGFKLWNEMNNQVLKNQPNLKSTWHDYKLRSIGAYAPTPTYEIPIDNGGGQLALGEWTYSVYQSPDGTTSADAYTAYMLGDHTGTAGNYSSVGLVKSYAETRPTVDNNSPEMTQVNYNDPLLNIFDHGTVVDEIAANLAEHNEDPPYSRDIYPGESGNMSRPLVVQQTTLGADGRASVGGFAAMCGLVEVETTSPIANDVYSVLIELEQGNYRGINAGVIE